MFPRLLIILVPLPCTLSRWPASFLKCHAKTKHSTPTKGSAVSDSAELSHIFSRWHFSLYKILVWHLLLVRFPFKVTSQVFKIPISFKMPLTRCFKYEMHPKWKKPTWFGRSTWIYSITFQISLFLYAFCFSETWKVLQKWCVVEKSLWNSYIYVLD